MNEVRHYEEIPLGAITVHGWDDPDGVGYDKIALIALAGALEQKYGEGRVEIVLDLKRGQLMIIVP